MLGWRATPPRDAPFYGIALRQWRTYTSFIAQLAIFEVIHPKDFDDLPDAELALSLHEFEKCPRKEGCPEQLRTNPNRLYSELIELTRVD